MAISKSSKLQECVHLCITVVLLMAWERVVRMWVFDPGLHVFDLASKGVRTFSSSTCLWRCLSSKKIHYESDQGRENRIHNTPNYWQHYGLLLTKCILQIMLINGVEEMSTHTLTICSNILKRKHVNKLFNLWRSLSLQLNTRPVGSITYSCWKLQKCIIMIG